MKKTTLRKISLKNSQEPLLHNSTFKRTKKKVTTSRSRINPVSIKQQAVNETLKNIRSSWSPNAKCCLCKERKWSDGMHIIRRSYSEELKGDSQNYIPGCRRCHRIMDDGTFEEFMKLPGANEILKIMESLDPLYAKRFKERGMNYDVTNNC